MSADTLRIVIGVVLLAHGVGHTLGLFPALGMAGSVENWSDHSWLLTSLIGETAARMIGVLLWAAAAVMAVMASLAVFGWLVPQAWFRNLALWSSVISLAGLFLFPNAFPRLMNKAGAVVVDAALLVILLWKPWPPISGIGQ